MAAQAAHAAGPSCTAADLVSPPRGWNSYDSTVGNHGINETVALASARFVAAVLKPHGYTYLTLDSGWFGTDSLIGADNGQHVDEWGRLLPNATFYPTGFGKLQALTKKLGLQWGFWIMGGIPRVAVDAMSKVKGTKYTADQIADTSGDRSKGGAFGCPWNRWLVFGSKRLEDGSLHPGAVKYYDSIAELYASWGVDIIKMDCVFGGDYYRGKAEMEQFARSMKKASKKPVLLSLSPGQTGNASVMGPIGAAFAGKGGAAQGMDVIARMTGDFWDHWLQLHDHFSGAAPAVAPLQTSSFQGDLDMLPLGYLRHEDNPTNTSGHFSNFNEDEARSLMAQWAMARAPLIWGGAASKDLANATTLALITNDRVLNVGNSSCGNGRVKTSHGGAVQYWAANTVSGGEKYIAIFNIGEETIEYDWDLLYDKTTKLPGPPWMRATDLSALELWDGDKPLPLAKSMPKGPGLGRLKGKLRPHASLLVLVSG